jgi:hypothetical protein
MFATPRGNISNLEYYSYTTIKKFPCFIQLFDVKFTTIAPHSLVVFQLQYVRYVKDAFSIIKLTYIYITSKVSEKYSTHVVTLV